MVQAHAQLPIGVVEGVVEAVLPKGAVIRNVVVPYKGGVKNRLC